MVDVDRTDGGVFEHVLKYEVTIVPIAISRLARSAGNWD
jgi:hypothetical protein